MRSIRSKLRNLDKPISSQSKLFMMAERLHIQIHLAITELRLRLAKGKNEKARARRALTLDALHGYWKSGVFPLNTYKKNLRTPIFIDKNGTHCAVGYLMVQTGCSSLAQTINETDRFVLVEQINCHEVTGWLDNCGLSRKEAALIQPGYGGFVLERVSYSLQDKVLAGISIIASLVLIVLVIFALRIARTRTAARPTKRNHLVGLATAIVVIIASFAVFLPVPHRAVQALISNTSGKETIVCEGWDTPRDKRPSVCNEFEDSGSLPGWRELPCEGICLQ